VQATAAAAAARPGPQYHNTHPVSGAGGLAIASYDLREKTGASIDIHVTYQSSAKEGDEIEIEGVAERVGGSLAFTKVNIFKVEDGRRGKSVATGSHTKYVKVA